MAEAEACAINIGPHERRKRLISGVVLLVVAVGVAGAQAMTGTSRWWRLGLFLPLAMAGIGFFQAFDKT